MGPPQESTEYQGSPESFRPLYLLTLKWKKQTNRTPLPQPGSDIDDDMHSVGNEIFSESLQVGLLSAVEHLCSLEPQLKNLAAGGEQPLRTFVDLSVARSAAMSAVKTVWCLAPEASEGRDGRVRRMLTVEADELKGQIDFLQREKSQAPPEEQKQIQATVDLFQRRRDEVISRIGGSVPRTTRWIDEAAEYVASVSPRTPPVLIIKGEWQLGSAIAHGHSWPAWNVRQTEDALAGTVQGTVTKTVIPTRKELFRAVSVAASMTEIGLSLWKRRGESR